MKVLIFGDGLLGKELADKTGWDVVSRKTTGLDITDYDSIDNLVSKYDTIVNCIANTDTYSEDRIEHMKVNYEFVATLADMVEFHDKVLVQISTEFVYAFNKKPANEIDLPLPAHNWYSYSKLLADEYIKVTVPKYLICRTLFKPMDFSPEEVWDVKTTGDKVDKIADLIIELIKKQAQGVYNVGTGKKKLYKLAPKGTPVIKAPKYVPTDTTMDLTDLNEIIGLD